MVDGVVPPRGYHTTDTPCDRVVFFGDSDIEYWQVEADFPGAVNLGIGGATVREAARHASAMAAAVRPKGFVVFVSGENDFEDDDTEAEPLFEHFKTVIEALLASVHHPRVIYLGTKPEPSTKELHAGYQRYDALIKDYATQLEFEAPAGSPPPLVVIDSWSRFHGMGNPKSLYRKDGLHLSRQGYAHWVEWVTEAMGQ